MDQAIESTVVILPCKLKSQQYTSLRDRIPKHVLKWLWGMNFVFQQKRKKAHACYTTHMFFFSQFCKPAFEERATLIIRISPNCAQSPQPQVYHGVN